jgi:hypothetical protein
MRTTCALRVSWRRWVQSGLGTRTRCAMRSARASSQAVAECEFRKRGRRLPRVSDCTVVQGHLSALRGLRWPPTRVGWQLGHSRSGRGRHDDRFRGQAPDPDVAQRSSVSSRVTRTVTYQVSAVQGLPWCIDGECWVIMK